MWSDPSRRGVMLVVSSPSGAGKTSLCRRLLVDHAELALSVSCTTRPPRQGEADGREYHFVTREAFDARVEADGFLEWAEVHDHRYGSPREPVEAALAEGRDVLFDIDWQGAAKIAAGAPEDVVRVFVLPPSMRELKRRLEARAQDHPDVIERRLGRAKAEIARWRDYDYVLLNDDFDRTYAELAHVYHAERQRGARNPGLKQVVAALMDEGL
jgi:guanylate kinase